jgi:hypothetical protein
MRSPARYWTAIEGQDQWAEWLRTRSVEDLRVDRIVWGGRDDSYPTDDGYQTSWHVLDAMRLRLLRGVEKSDCVYVAPDICLYLAQAMQAVKPYVFQPAMLPFPGSFIWFGEDWFEIEGDHVRAMHVSFGRDHSLFVVYFGSRALIAHSLWTRGTKPRRNGTNRGICANRLRPS